MLIVHDSHSAPDAEQPLDVLRWRGRKMGLLEIGYHLIVDRSGAVHRIRDVLAVGSHCPGYNHTSVGVCLIGGLGERNAHVDNFTEAQKLSLTFIAEAFLRQWPMLAQVVGHNELRGYKNTGRPRCPSLSMDKVREGLERKLAGPTLTEMTNGLHPDIANADADAASHAGPRLPYLKAEAHPAGGPHDLGRSVTYGEDS